MFLGECYTSTEVKGFSSFLGLSLPSKFGFVVTYRVGQKPDCFLPRRVQLCDAVSDMLPVKIIELDLYHDVHISSPAESQHSTMNTSPN